MALAMSDLAGDREMHKSKFIDRSRFCQIQWSDNGPTVETKNSEADRLNDPAERAGAGGQGDSIGVRLKANGASKTILD